MFWKNLGKAIGFTVLMLTIYIAVYTGITFILSLCLSFITYLNNPGISLNILEEQMNLQLTQFTIPMMLIGNIFTLALIIFVFSGRKDKFVSYVGFRKIKLADTFLILGFGAFFNILITALVDLAIINFPINQQLSDYEKLMDPLFKSGFILVFLVVAISAPIFEEIIFRGIIFNDFKKALPVWISILLQALLFGLFHGNWIQGTYATILGIILGIVYYKYRSIWAVILLHFSYNTISLLFDQWLHTNLNLFEILSLGLGGTLILGFVLIRSYDKDYYCDTLKLCNVEGEV